jgi:hypothetical protein
VLFFCLSIGRLVGLTGICVIAAPGPAINKPHTGGGMLYRLSSSLGVHVALAVALLSWMVLSSLALAQGSIHIGRKDAHVLMPSFCQHVLPSFVMVFDHFVNLVLDYLSQHWMVSATGRIFYSYFGYYPNFAWWIM